MGEALTREEQAEKKERLLRAMTNKMRVSLSNMSQSAEGINVIRYFLHESRFLSPLTYETQEGVNTDVLLINEAKRQMYLGLRGFMDVETIKRVELDGIEEETNEGGDK